MKISLLIPDGESTLTHHVVHCLSMNRGVDIHILSKDPNANIRHSRLIASFHHYDFKRITHRPPEETGDPYVDELIRFHHYDFEKSDEIIGEIISYAGKTGSTIVFPVDEHIVKILAGQKEKLTAGGLSGLMPDPAMFSIAIDKWQLARFIFGKDIAHPVTVRYHNGVDEDSINKLRFPVIIKPINQGNALGIQSFQDPEKLWTFFRSQKLMHEYIVQPLIKGYDIDCSVLCENGKIRAYTIQRGIESPKVRFRAAVGIEFLYDEKVIRVVEKLMRLLNWSGVAHIDLRYDEEADEVKVIEINARYWGSLLGSLNAGVNFPDLAVRILLDEKFEKVNYQFTKYFMGKSPLRKILGTALSGKNERVRFRDTSLFYRLRDPKPVFFEILAKIKSKF